MQDTSATIPDTPVVPNLREPSEAQIKCYVQVIRGQTDMSDEDILVSLKDHNYNILNVIRSYITGVKSGTAKKGDKATTEADEPADVATSPAPAIERNTQSVNQLRFNEIRNFMDTAAESFRRNQEMNRIYNQVMEKKKMMAAMAAAKTVSESAAAVAEATAAASQPETNETPQERSKL
jgi:hypothetical protein